MTPAEREELALWFSRYHQQHRVEHRGVTWEDGNAYLNWLDENAERIAAALRDPVGECICKTNCPGVCPLHGEPAFRKQPANQNAVSVAADMLRDVAADLDRAVRVSQAGVAGSDPPSGVFLPGQSQPASAETDHANMVIAEADIAILRSAIDGFVAANFESVPPSKFMRAVELLQAECRKALSMVDRGAGQLASAEIDALRAENATLRTRAERAEAEVALMRPVVEAAVALRDEEWSKTWADLTLAVDTYRAAKGKP